MGKVIGPIRTRSNGIATRSEGKVFQEIGEKFQMVENAIMEYHYQSSNSENKLSDIIRLIEEQKHEHYITSIDKTTDVKSTSCYMIKTKRIIN